MAAYCPRHLEHPVDEVVGQPIEVAMWHHLGEAGRVDQDVEPAVPGGDLIAHRQQRCGVANIAGSAVWPSPLSVPSFLVALAAGSAPGRCVITTRAPSSASITHVAAPMPPAPPMTSATFPASEMPDAICVVLRRAIFAEPRTRRQAYAVRGSVARQRGDCRPVRLQNE